MQIQLNLKPIVDVEDKDPHVPNQPTVEVEKQEAKDTLLGEKQSFEQRFHESNNFE